MDPSEQERATLTHLDAVCDWLVLAGEARASLYQLGLHKDIW